MSQRVFRVCLRPASVMILRFRVQTHSRREQHQRERLTGEINITQKQEIIEINTYQQSTVRPVFRSNCAETITTTSFMSIGPGDCSRTSTASLLSIKQSVLPDSPRVCAGNLREAAFSQTSPVSMFVLSDICCPQFLQVESQHFLNNRGAFAAESQEFC